MKKILFLCVENSCRSQMAEGLARKLGEGIIQAYSAGSKPSGRVNPDAIKVMEEIGIDISQNQSKSFNDLKHIDFDYAITLGCGDVCPFSPAKEHVEWDIKDPKGKDLVFFRKIRDEMRERISELIRSVSGEAQGKTIERHFDTELNDLYQHLLRMASMVQQEISGSIEALSERNENKAKEVIDFDRAIDELELAIDEKCIDLIARYQPMAIDLRFLATGMKINAELERIADLAVDIAQRALELAGQPLIKPLIDIPELAVIAQQMVDDAINAFVKRDADLAGRVVLFDAEADRLKNLVQQELIYDYMVKDGTTAPRAVPLLLVARHLERICDHATNIAEDVIYMVNAEVVRHHPEKLQTSKISKSRLK